MKKLLRKLEDYLHNRRIEDEQRANRELARSVGNPSKVLWVEAYPGRVVRVLMSEIRWHGDTGYVAPYDLPPNVAALIPFTDGDSI